VFCVRTQLKSNLFKDLEAAILANALDEAEYDTISYLLEVDLELLESWLQAADVGQRSYWVCAFCVNQHTSICGGNPHHSKDSVTGEEHSTCACGLAKAWIDTEPRSKDLRSIPCEMNKFDDMMEFLSASEGGFSQVVAVDASFVLFSRAWCVAEIATAHKMGMRQWIKMVSSQVLNKHEPKLRELHIAEMEATRPQDKEEILAKIPDQVAFDQHLQKLLFSDLLDAWKRMDIGQLGHVGHMLRWQEVAHRHGTAQMFIPMEAVPDDHLPRI